MQNLCSCGKKGGRALAESISMTEERESLEELVGRLLRESGQTIACAESCTGGLLTSRLTDVAGSSAYVMGAVVSYTNEVKAALVGVRQATLKAFGAVSEQTAREMAERVLAGCGAVEIIAETDLAFRCPCSKERVERVLLGLGRDDLASLVDDGKAEVCCHFCGEKYLFTGEEMERLLREKSGEGSNAHGA